MKALRKYWNKNTKKIPLNDKKQETQNKLIKNNTNHDNQPKKNKSNNIEEDNHDNDSNITENKDINIDEINQITKDLEQINIEEEKKENNNIKDSEEEEEYTDRDIKP